MLDKPTKTAVIGYPIEHSLSPLIHNHWLECNGVQGQYQKIAIEPDAIKEKLPPLLDNLKRQQAGGYNVTVPHKQAVMPFLDAISQEAQAIGAVNTIYFDQETGKVTGTNTDAYGFWQNLISQNEQIEAWNKKEKNILMIGAGGAARAVLYALINQGFQNINIVNRTREKAECLKQVFENPNVRISVLDWHERHPQEDINLVINTTSLGMKGQDDLDINLENCSSGTIIHDIVYAPLMTNLLRIAEKMELPYCTGLGMLIHQACPAFKHFFGVEPKIDETLQALMMAKTQK